MKRVILILCFAMCILNLYSQIFNYNHNLVMWGGTGYSSIYAGLPKTSVPGKIGVNIGIGYEYNYKNFILQTGLELQRVSSVMKYKDFAYTIPMLDTEGREFDGIFEFNNNRENNILYIIDIPLLFGVSFYNIYFLAGGKVQFSFHNKVKTTSELTTKARYGIIIGSDGEGLLYDMPNHGLETVKQNRKGNFSLSPVYTLSLEAGKTFKQYSGRRSHNAQTEYLRVQRENENWLNKRVFNIYYYRLAFFCDYGFTSLNNKVPDYKLIINNAILPGAYTPSLNHIIFAADKINTLYLGVKFTIVFQFKGRYPCRCEGY